MVKDMDNLNLIMSTKLLFKCNKIKLNNLKTNNNKLISNHINNKFKIFL